MVTTLNLKQLELSKKENLLKYGNTDPLRFMHTLESVGFQNVNIEYLKDDTENLEYQAITAEKGLETVDSAAPKSSL